MLDPDSADLARELLAASYVQRSGFFSFFTLWMAFNGWMACVTDAANDAKMINALADHQRLVDRFSELMQHCPDFHEKVLAFAKMWPVINVRDLRWKLGCDAFSRYSREQLMEEVICKGVKHRPEGWSDGADPTWPQLLKTIYLVRCNLFHGTKSPQNSRDHKLVVASDQILRMFIERSECFEWAD